jgi:hypothetical protein
MKSLIWKEWRENLKWAVLPSLVILLPMLLLGGPNEAMPGVSGAFLFYLIAAVFGAALGFVQVFFESRGDHRAILLHRPLSRSRIFVSKVIAGVGIYLLAMGIPFVCVQAWMAIPGHMPAPYQWGNGLPWLADILAGVVYYFAGMLTAQREARWYGSRGLGLVTAFLCTVLVWTLPEFWQALLAILVLGAFLGLAAWGSFLAGGAYVPQPRLARAALAGTLVIGLLVASFIGKLAIGQWLDSGMSFGETIDRQGRLLIFPWKTGVGPLGTIADLDGQVPADLVGKRVDRNLIEEIEAPRSMMDWPTFRSYRNHGRFYVEYANDTRPGPERWFYAADKGLLLGYDMEFGQLVGGFGPDGFVPAGEQPRRRFEGPLSYPTRFWDANSPSYLAFPGGVYDVDFSRRTIQKLFTPAGGETVLWASQWRDRREKYALVVISTDRSIHVLTEAGVPVMAVPREFEQPKYHLATVRRLEGPERFVVRYVPSQFLEPDEALATPGYLLVYDATGRELSRKTVPPRPAAKHSYGILLFGLVTPPVELTALAAPLHQLRSQARSSNGIDTWVHLELLEEWTGDFLPGIARSTSRQRSLLPGFVALSLLSSAACALVCFLLGRRCAFSLARCVGWAACGALFGWTGLVLLLVLEDWPARIRCPSCGQLRVVDRECCEHCGAPHAPAAQDGTEIFEPLATAPAALAAR